MKSTDLPFKIKEESIEDKILLAIEKSDLKELEKLSKNRNSLIYHPDGTEEYIYTFVFQYFGCYEGYWSVFEKLYHHPKVDINFEQLSMVWAAGRGSVQQLKTLLADERIVLKIDSRLNDYLSRACEYGHLEAVQILLQDERIKITSNALWQASDKKHRDVVKELLMSSRLTSHHIFDIMTNLLNTTFKKDDELFYMCFQHPEVRNLILGADEKHYGSITGLTRWLGVKRYNTLMLAAMGYWSNDKSLTDNIKEKVILLMILLNSMIVLSVRKVISSHKEVEILSVMKNILPGD